MTADFSNNRDKAESLYKELHKNEVEILLEIDYDYPKQIKSVLGDKCPAVLFVKGNKKLLTTRSVGFCGSRNVSNKGLNITSQCSQQLVERNITVVSGYARGTDMAAHKVAVQNGGNTIFVLAEGILEYSHKPEIRELLNNSNHVFVSQFIPTAKWSVGNAMYRNSVILGLSKAMILVESGKTGGTFTAGQEALKLGLPLFVIDYANPEISAEANPYFLSRGSYAIRSRNGLPNLDRLFSVINEMKVREEQITFEMLK